MVVWSSAPLVVRSPGSGRCRRIQLCATVSRSTELSGSGAGVEVIMSIAGHVSRAMLSRYSHVRMEAKRRALDGIAACGRAADEKRQQEIERQQQAATVLKSALVQ